MRKQLRVSPKPFRGNSRHLRAPRLIQISRAKKRGEKREFQSRKTVRLPEGLATKRGPVAWSPEQLARIWENTAG